MSRSKLVFNVTTGEFHYFKIKIDTQIRTLSNTPQLTSTDTVVAIDMPTGNIWEYDNRDAYNPTLRVVAKIPIEYKKYMFTNHYQLEPE